MRLTVEILPRAKVELKSLPAELQREAIIAIDHLAENPYPGDSVKLRGRNDHYRLRVDGYRIIYRVRRGKILVTRIAPRGSVYRGF